MADPIARDRFPTPLSFPRSFNPLAVDQWFTACKQLPNNPDGAWKLAVQRYTDLCKKAGVLPFQKSVTPNFAIQTYLSKKRRRFVLFLNQTGLMDTLPITRLIKRNAYVESYGFSLVIEAQVRVEDPTWQQQLTRFRMPYQFSLLRDRGRYVLRLDPGLTVYIHNPVATSKDTWHISYEIKCPVHPDFEGMDADKKTFIIEHLWKPVATSIRPFKGNRIRYL